ncbi:MAG: carbamoyltransferase [bacterium]|nr:carbamoyltransferase [bacterium]MBK7669878.1 carbamoyltransferase [bacterium]
MNILGLSAFYHDSAACLVQDGRVVAAAQEERFTRRKHDAGFPRQAMRYCLGEGNVGPGQLDAVVFYDKPLTKFVRILESAFAVSPRGLRPFLQAMPVWLRDKLWIPAEIERELRLAGAGRPGRLMFTEHHESHAASAFFASPFESAAILTLDGVGEWATSSLGQGRGNRLRILEEIHYPHSLGLLYSAFTYFTGFKVNSGEYKLMGLAPYGEPRYVQRIYDHLLDLRSDGSFRLNLDYFGYIDGLVMTNDRFARLFDGPPRSGEAEITQREMDLARSIQEVTEEVVLRMARHAHRVTGERHLCLAGGVALNCVANGRVLREGPFADLWIQPASGDAGGAVGAALYAWHMYADGARILDGRDRMAGAFLGPAYTDQEIADWLEHEGHAYRTLADGDLEREVARRIARGEVVGLHQGRMEFGPRALGNRSIVGDARSPGMQSQLNLKIKYRESFRPFAPSVLAERVRECFELGTGSPYMLLVAPVARERWLAPEAADARPANRPTDVVARVNQVRSDIPAVTHVDHSARIQTVHEETNPRYHRIITEFANLTGCPTIINTSFNVRGEPIVCTPEDAYRCFMRTEMDTLVMGNHVLVKSEQAQSAENADWRREFQLD